MAYNKENLLTRVAEIRKIVLENQKKGSTQKWIYDNIVYPRYHISYATFYAYMGMSNVETELKKLQAERKRRAELK